MAVNRQTRMLANLSLVNCYDTTAMPSDERERRMLISAKENLQNMAFFGLSDFQDASHYLFTRTFKIEFRRRLEQARVTQSMIFAQSPLLKKIQTIRKINKLDIELYEFAKQLFFSRVSFWVRKDKKDGKTDKIPKILLDLVVDEGTKT